MMWLYMYNPVLICGSPGIMLLIYTRTSSSVPLKILSIEDGTVLKSFNHLLHRNKKVDFIEQFNEKLLVKQEGENLQILDVIFPLMPQLSFTIKRNKLLLLFRFLTLGIVGTELPINRSEQDRVHDSIGLYLSL
jgi:hypothetical protein